MSVDFQVLESQLTETEMALVMMTNVSLNASMKAGADPNLILADLKQHQTNFEALGQKKAAHISAAMIVLVEHASGIKPVKY